MAIYGESLTIQYIAWDTVNNVPKTGDASNHTLRWVKDGTAAAPTNAPSEVDAANAPGLYKLTLTATETQCWVGTLCGKSSTSGVVIMPLTLTFERLPTAAPGSSGGLPVIGQAPLTNLDAAVSSRSTLTAADVWSYGSRTLSGFSFQVTVGGYTTGQSPSEQLQSLGYSSARAAKLDNLDAAVSSRLAASSYIEPDNASIAAIKSQTDKLSFVGSDVKATLDNEQVTVAVNNDKTGYSLTADYDRAKTALAITEYIAPDNASIAAIKSQTDKLSFVGTDVKATLDGEAVIVGSYATNQSPGEQIQGIGYTPTRAAKLDNLDVPISYLANVVIISSGTVSSDTNNSPIQFKTNLSGSATKYVGLFLKFAATAAPANEIREIVGFDAATGVVTLNKALTTIPNTGDAFYLIGYSGR